MRILIGFPCIFLREALTLVTLIGTEETRGDEIL